MIDVTLRTRNDNVVGFKITGHANYCEYGSDIVCSAVTILAYSALNTLDLYSDKVIFKDEDDIMTLESKDLNEDVKVVFKYFETGIQTLLGNYKKYVNLHYEEV